MNKQNGGKAEYPYRCIVSDMPVVRAVSEGVPVYGFGYAHVYGASPRLMPQIPIQKGDCNPFERISLKRSHEISFNLLGSTTPRMPRLTQNDYRPLEPVHLIDGDPETCWSSRTQPAHDCEPSWIKIDLAVETQLKSVALRKRKSRIDRSNPGSIPPDMGEAEVGQAMTDHIEIRLSRDACHWETVYDGLSGDALDRYDFDYEFMPRPAKQIWIIGSGYRRMENMLYCFSIACVEAYTMENENVALVGRGTGITVSSTLVGGAQEIESHRWFWPVQHDMGLKWARVGYHDDTINWHWVEREKGVLEVDPVTDASVTELVENGVNVVMCLNFGNRLYQGNPTRRLPQLWEWYYENPEPPKNDEALWAWDRYVRFMVAKFRDRVSYFEVWNEWNIDLYWGDKTDFPLFIRISKIAYKAIRELAPRAKVVMGSVSGFPYGIARCDADELERMVERTLALQAVRALAREVDVIGFHPFYSMDPAGENFLRYVEDFKAFQVFCGKAGFAGEYMASEYNVSANYPATEGDNWWGGFNASELQKAKYCARIAIMHTALNVGSFFCETWSSNYPMDLSLMRRGFPAYPVAPMQPSAAYYVTRNLSTLLDGLHGSARKVELSGQIADVEQYVLQGEGQLLIAVWLKGRAEDQSRYAYLDIRITGCFNAVSGINPMNGEEQKLYVKTDGNMNTIRNVIVGDYPVMIRMVF